MAESPAYQPAATSTYPPEINQAVGPAPPNGQARLPSAPRQGGWSEPAKDGFCPLMQQGQHRENQSASSGVGLSNNLLNNKPSKKKKAARRKEVVRQSEY